MKRFTYNSGQRPLEGYTLKRGVGQGGFGEVYFAISDGGKEVALKLLRGHVDVELRGIAHCLNMKHPNLVHVYDLKETPSGEMWLVMEYVLGESLAQVLSRHPKGLTEPLIKEWFGSLSRAVAHLHDRGVVHRDLKPANIFIEAGVLKVGDYGLCKSVSTSQRQSRTVGTVHYMAPEVSTGNYTQSIDIYACGVILHEMLTGILPFDGESDGEILMKHMTATPDLRIVPDAFRPVIAKALDKNPHRRFGSITEMAKVVDATLQSLTQPTRLPHHDAPTRPLPPPGFVPPPLPGESPTPAAEQPPLMHAVPLPIAYPAKAEAPAKQPVGFLTSRDRLMGLTQSLLLAPVVAALGIVPYGLLSNTLDSASLLKMLLVTTALAWAVLLGSGTATYRSPDNWGRRMRLGGLGLFVGGLSYWLDGWNMPRWVGFSGGGSPDSYLFGLIHLSGDSFPTAVRYLIYFGCVLAIGRWWRPVARDRAERIGMFPILAAGFWATVLLFLWPWQAGSAVGGVVPVVLCAIAVQAASAWVPPAPSASKKLRLRSIL